MDAVTKAIKKIRHIPIVPLKIENPQDVRLAEAESELRAWELHRQGVEFVRDRNFEKAKQARAESLERKRLEKERQDEIAETRLKNLKKARKALERKRNEG